MGGCSRRLPAFASSASSSSTVRLSSRVVAARLVEEGLSLVRLERQCRLEQLLHELGLSSHNTQSHKALIVKTYTAGEGVWD